MDMRMIAAAVSVTASVFIVTGCTRKPTSPPSAPMLPEEARFFDDGMDFVHDLQEAEGSYRFVYLDMREALTQLSDLVAVVRIHAVFTEEYHDGRKAVRIDAAPVEVLYGDFPEDVLSLRTFSSSEGYYSIMRDDARPEGHFILFFRRFPEEIRMNPQAEGFHFHLSKSSPKELVTLRERIYLRKKMEEEQHRPAKRRLGHHLEKQKQR